MKLIEKELSRRDRDGIWRPTCDECCEKADNVVQIGEEPDYESSTAKICEPCLRKALALIEEAKESA